MRAFTLAAILGSALILGWSAARADDWRCVRCDPPTETFAWTPATGGPDRYEVWTSFAGEPWVLYKESEIPQADISWIFGRYIEAKVRGMLGDLAGPWSLPSERERIFPDFDYTNDGLVDFTDFMAHVNFKKVYGRRLEGRRYK